MNQLVKRTLALGALAILLPACGDGGDGESTTAPPASDTPTPTATATAIPTPTPTATAVPGPPINGAYRSTGFILAADEGMDFDDNGAPDNGFIPLYELSVNIIGSGLYQGSYAALTEAGVPGQQAILIAQNLRDSFELALSVESFNTLALRSMNTDGWNQILSLYGEPESFSAAWVMAAVNEDGSSYALAETFGSHSGSIDGSTGTLSPSTVNFDFTKIYSSSASAGTGLSANISLRVEQTEVEFSYASSALSNGVIGGIVWEDAMLDFMESLIPTEVCPTQVEDCIQLDILEDTLLTLEDEYNNPERAGLWEISGGAGKGVFVGYGFESEKVVTNQ